MILTLRVLAECDEEIVLKQFNDPLMTRWMPVPSPFTTGDFTRLLDTVKAARSAGRLLDCVGLDDRGQFVGAATFDTKTSEFGFWVVRERWGAGDGTALVSKFISQRLTPAGTKRVIAAVHEENIRSQCLLCRCGFQRVGSRPYHFVNNPVNSAIFYRKDLLGASSEAIS